MSTAKGPWTVLKFGGTSVADAEGWAVIRAQAARCVEAGERALIVCSAVAGVTDLLESLPEVAIRDEHDALLQQIATKHALLGEGLGVEATRWIREETAELRRLAQGIHLLEEVSPGQRARIQAMGELMSTRLGAAYLAARGVDSAWMDARTLLTSTPDPRRSEERNLLSAVCDVGPSEEARALLDGAGARVVITQGFIAADPEGRTVLLGRGGSDTAAAYLAARIGAARCEIWTDVPGLFSADPRKVPQARLLRSLSYDEAQEIATTGAKVLHPRCILPLKTHRIPLHIRSTKDPQMEGTVITSGGAPGPAVKCVSARTGLSLVSMDTLGMWQQVGFLADAFAVFKEHGLSVDLVSTSETNVTVSLDPSANSLSGAPLDRFLADLNRVCSARIIENAAAVSLVGRGIRAALHKLGPALEVFDEQRVHLVSQAASDLNLSFVVDDDQAERLTLRLHELLLGNVRPDPTFGPRWAELFGGEEPAARVSISAWWRERRDELLEIAAEGAAYVYDLPTVAERARGLLSISAVDRVLYAVKANPHGAVLRRLAELGVGFEVVSIAEIEAVRAAVPGLEPERLLFTPNFAPRAEYEAALEQGVRLTVDSLHPLRCWPELFRGKEIHLRLDPGRGRGHHDHVRTAGSRSKFGIAASELDELTERIESAGARVTGLHAHSGSGILTPGNWSEIASFLGEHLERFPEARVLDVGGGFGVPERPGQAGLDLAAVGERLARVKEAWPDRELHVEPGRYLVAEAGVLLARVTQLKNKGGVRYVGIETGMNSLIRPALYGAYHYICNLSRMDAPLNAEPVTVVGPICESGDVLGRERDLPECGEGDVLLIATAGAYGRVMSSRYNLREPAREVVLGDQVDAQGAPSSATIRSP